MPALTLEIEHGIDHVLDHAGARDLTILGHMAHKDHRHVPPLGKIGQLMRRRAHLRHRSRRAFHIVGPHRLNRIDHRQLRLLCLQRGQDVAQIGGCGHLHRRIPQSQTLRPHPHLRGCFLARDIDRFQPRLGKARGGLQQQRGLADPRITAHQNGA